MVTATFRFYEELNDFLPPERRKQDITVPCARAATTKHMIEALGVPHTEVELVLVNGESVGFERVLALGGGGLFSEEIRTRPELSARIGAIIETDLDLIDPERLAFAPGAFDLIASPLALHSINDLPGALIQLRHGDVARVDDVALGIGRRIAHVQEQRVLVVDQLGRLQRGKGRATGALAQQRPDQHAA